MRCHRCFGSVLHDGDDLICLSCGERIRYDERLTDRGAHTPTWNQIHRERANQQKRDSRRRVREKAEGGSA